MALTMHAASASIFVHMLGNLAAWLEMAEAHATSSGTGDPAAGERTAGAPAASGGGASTATAPIASRPLTESDLLSLRLAPDMLPFAAQVKIAADIARMTMARLTRTELASWPNDPTTLAALITRVRQAIVQIEVFSDADLQGSETCEISIPQRGADPLVFTGQTLLQRWALPNFFFHATTAYALMRHAGVPLGKADYLGLA